MKTALLLIMVAAGYAGYGQVMLKKSKNSSTQFRMPPIETIAPGIYTLKPDNMPCVVPDMSTVKPMPNTVKPGDEVAFMPNAYESKPLVTPQKKKEVPGKKSEK